jgi:hypothetical protein
MTQKVNNLIKKWKTIRVSIDEAVNNSNITNIDKALWDCIKNDIIKLFGKLHDEEIKNNTNE